MRSSSVFLAGSSRSSRLSATVTSSAPDASRAASISWSLRYLPVPKNRRERSSTPATVSFSVAGEETADTATGLHTQRLSQRNSSAARICVRSRSQLAYHHHRSQAAGGRGRRPHIEQLRIQRG